MCVCACVCVCVCVFVLFHGLDANRRLSSRLEVSTTNPRIELPCGSELQAILAPLFNSQISEIAPGQLKSCKLRWDVLV